LGPAETSRLYRPEFADELMSRFGYNVDVITKCFLAAVLWPLDRAAHEQ
jgi:hypothetical protein